MTKATILKKNLDDKMWPEIVFAMIYIKNVCSIKAFNKNNFYHVQQNNNLDI